MIQLGMMWGWRCWSPTPVPGMLILEACRVTVLNLQYDSFSYLMCFEMFEISSLNIRYSRIFACSKFLRLATFSSARRPLWRCGYLQEATRCQLQLLPVPSSGVATLGLWHRDQRRPRPAWSEARWRDEDGGLWGDRPSPIHWFLAFPYQNKCVLRSWNQPSAKSQKVRLKDWAHGLQVEIIDVSGEWLQTWLAACLESRALQFSRVLSRQLEALGHQFFFFLWKAVKCNTVR